MGFMKREDVVTLMEKIKLAYPNAYKSLNEEQMANTITLWADRLSPGIYKAKHAFYALNKYIDRERMPPTISDIISGIKGAPRYSEYPPTPYSSTIEIPDSAPMSDAQLEKLKQTLPLMAYSIVLNANIRHREKWANEHPEQSQADWEAWNAERDKICDLVMKDEARVNEARWNAQYNNV